LSPLAQFVADERDVLIGDRTYLYDMAAALHWLRTAPTTKTAPDEPMVPTEPQAAEAEVDGDTLLLDISTQANVAVMARWRRLQLWTDRWGVLPGMDWSADEPFDVNYFKHRPERKTITTDGDDEEEEEKEEDPEPPTLNPAGLAPPSFPLAFPVPSDQHKQQDTLPKRGKSKPKPKATSRAMAKANPKVKQPEDPDTRYGKRAAAVTATNTDAERNRGGNGSNSVPNKTGRRCACRQGNCCFCIPGHRRERVLWLLRGQR
jgi:hypothetical protein